MVKHRSYNFFCYLYTDTNSQHHITSKYNHADMSKYTDMYVQSMLTKHSL